MLIATVAGLFLSFIACFIVLVIAPLTTDCINTPTRDAGTSDAAAAGAGSSVAASAEKIKGGRIRVDARATSKRHGRRLSLNGKTD